MQSPAPEAPGQLSDNEMYDRMVSAILDHRLPPGTKLVEDKLAAAFGVSRTRVRPVLVRLANEQVVTLTPNRGASIAQPTPQEALEVFEARRLIEPRLVELFIANATDADIAALRSCIDEEESARASGDMRRAIRLRDAKEAARRMLDHLARIESQLEFTPPASEAPDLMSLLGMAG